MMVCKKSQVLVIILNREDENFEILVRSYHLYKLPISIIMFTLYNNLYL
jgi:hypothetical protein